MRILITGSKGQLGWELERRGWRHGLETIAYDIDELDITDREAVEETIYQGGLSLVVNAAAYTAVDQAELEAEIAFSVNQKGPHNLALACSKAGIPLVHISTDYVFDGSKKRSYLEIDPVAPLGVYGNSKAQGEAEVRNLITEHIILRTSWVYGIHGQNFVKTMLRLGSEKETLQVVDDQYGCPTFAADLAEAILSIAARIRKGSEIPWGTYHYCGKGKTSWCGFAKAIFDIARQGDSFFVKRVEPINTADYPTRAKRPANSVLSCTLIGRQFGIYPRPWQEGLTKMIHSIQSI